MDRLRSAETDRFAAGVVEFLETRGDGKRREGVGVGNDDEFEVEGEGEGEGDKYLDETCLDLGLVDLLGPTIPLSFSEGNNGGLDWFVVSEIAATIIYETIQNKTQMKIFKTHLTLSIYTKQKITKLPFFLRLSKPLQTRSRSIINS